MLQRGTPPNDSYFYLTISYSSLLSATSILTNQFVSLSAPPEAFPIFSLLFRSLPVSRTLGLYLSRHSYLISSFYLIYEHHNHSRLPIAHLSMRVRQIILATLLNTTFLLPPRLQPRMYPIIERLGFQSLLLELRDVLGPRAV